MKTITIPDPSDSTKTISLIEVGTIEDIEDPNEINRMKAKIRAIKKARQKSPPNK